MLSRRPFQRVAAVLPLAALIAGCSGGNASSSLPSANSVPTAAALAKAGYAKVQLSFSFQRGTSASIRSRQFINGNATASFTASVNAANPSIFNCTNSSAVAGVTLFTCGGSVDAPLNQTDTFVVNTYDGPNGTGYLLSTNGPGGNTATVLPNQQNNVNIVTLGVVASVAPLYACAQGGAYVSHVPLQFLDADGGLISGPLSAGGAVLQNAILPLTLSAQSAANAASGITVGTTAYMNGMTTGSIDGTQPVTIDNTSTALGAGIMSAITAPAPAGAKTLSVTNLNYVRQIAYVTDRTNNTVTGYEMASQATCVKFSTGPNAPAAMAISDDGTRLFVSAGNAVSIFDTSTDKLVATVPIAGAAAGLAYDTNAFKLYVANNSATSAAAAVQTIGYANTCNTVSNPCTANPLTISGNQGQVSSPYGLALDGTNLYFSNAGNSFIDVIQLSGGYIFTASLAGGPVRGAAIATGGLGKLYVQAIGVSSNGYLDTVNVSGQAATGGGGYALTGSLTRTSPRAIAVNGGTVYVGVQNGIQQYTAGSAAAGSSMFTVGSAPGAIDFGFGKLFAAFPSGGVVAFTADTFLTFPAGGMPSDIVLGPDGITCGAPAFSRIRMPKKLC